jgi:hypothetical protein
VRRCARGHRPPHRRWRCPTCEGVFFGFFDLQRRKCLGRIFSPISSRSSVAFDFSMHSAITLHPLGPPCRVVARRGTGCPRNAEPSLRSRLTKPRRHADVPTIIGIGYGHDRRDIIVGVAATPASFSPAVLGRSNYIARMFPLRRPSPETG